MNAPELSVVICTYNRSAMLVRTLKSFFEQKELENAPFELIVVDNNSTDDTRRVVEGFGPRPSLRYTFEPRQGLSAARNRGIQESRGRFVAFLDDDVIVDAHWLTNLRRAFAETNAAVVGGRSYLAFDTPPPDWLGPEFRTLLSEADLGSARIDVPDGKGLFGLNLSFEKSALVGAGGFDEQLGRTGTALLGGEETAVMRRIAAAGGRIVYAPGVVVGHIIDGPRLRWDYFERLAVGMGRSLALACAQSQSGFEARWFSLFRSAAACWHTWLSLRMRKALGRSPYEIYRALRRYLTARSRFSTLKSLPRENRKISIQTHPEASLYGSSADKTNSDALRVAFLPEWFNNPYQVRLDDELSKLGARMIRLGRTAREIARNLRRHRPHILHLHWLHAFYEVRPAKNSAMKLALSLLGLTATRWRGTRIVWTAHNLKHHETLAPRLDRFINRWVAHRADAIIAHGESAKRMVIQEFNLTDDRRVHVIPHGNYLGAYPNTITHNEARTQLDLAEGDFVFLFLGQIRPYKGVLELVEAFRSLESAAARLLIAGKARDAADAALIVQRIAGDRRIRFDHGYVADERIQMYMNAADAVVLPYRDILTSGAAILAMSFGKACLAPRIGGLVDLFEDDATNRDACRLPGAFFYETSHPDGLRKSLAKAVESREMLADMGARNLKVVASWSWRHVAERTLRVYQSCLPTA